MKQFLLEIKKDLEKTQKQNERRKVSETIKEVAKIMRKVVKHNQDLFEDLGQVDHNQMIGRAIMQNIYAFSTTKTMLDCTVDERIGLLKTHLELFETTWGKYKNFNGIKKYVKLYIRGFDEANELRQKLMETDSFLEIRKILTKLLC